MASLASVTAATFTVDVLSSNGPVLVDFWAEWCGPCRQVAPVLERIAAEKPELTIVKVNVDEEPSLAAAYQVTGIPTLALFVGGQQVTQVVGARPKAALLRDLEPHL